MIPIWKGKPTNATYHAVTLFVDHASRYQYLEMHQYTGADEAVAVKEKFERHAKGCGVKINKFRADNGVFATNKWRQSLIAGNQVITYCRVNAHWQNGIAERNIRTIVERARTMLLHAIS